MENKNNTISAETLVNSLRTFCLLNRGDVDTTDLLICVGADVMNVTYDEMERMINGNC